MQYSAVQMLLGPLLVIVPVSVGIKVILLMMKMNTDPDQAQQYKTRIKNALLYAVIAETALDSLLVLYTYIS